MSERSNRRALATCVVGMWATAAWCAGDTPAGPAADLGRFFGFEAPRLIVADEDCGPVIVADMNGDGRNDIVLVNNRKSRIEVHLQRAAPLTEEQSASALKPNELPPSLWYERKEITVSNRVTSIRAVDIDGDGRMDLIYAGQPAEIVILRQDESGAFKPAGRKRVPGLSTGRDALAAADVMGDARLEVVAIAKGQIVVFPVVGSGAGVALGDAIRLGTAAGQTQQVAAFFVEDYDGNGLLDIMAAAPEDAAPVRLWLQRSNPRATGSGKNGMIGPELRFEMPQLREGKPMRFPGRAGASLALIERASRRLVCLDVSPQTIEPASGTGAEREVQAEVYGFGDEEVKDRAVAVADIDGDGRLDLIAADPKGNSLMMFRQEQGLGLSRAERFSAFKAPKSLAVGRWREGAGDGPRDVFVLSEEEKAVGVSVFDAGTGRLSFPAPVALATAGGAPVAIAALALRAGPALAVVVQNKREHTLEVHRPGATGAQAVKIELTGVTRPPRSMLAADIDHDGAMDLLLFTPGEPMVMVRSIEDAPGAAPGGGAKVLTDKTMPQFGLVQSAGPDNTGLLDVDGDGHEELLIADKNFVRACAFDAEKGWRVVEQVTDADSATQFVGLTVLRQGSEAPAEIVASDKTGKRLVVMRRADGAWKVVDRLRLTGFEPKALHAGAFSGDGQPNLLCISDDGFGVVRLAGARVALQEFASWRSDSDSRLEHEIGVGDLNSDGLQDMAVLDAKEHRCQIFTFSAKRRLLPATEWEVFQSRVFERQESRAFEPSAAIIQDVTGDGANDLILLSHDRVIVYPQMKASR